MDPGEERWTLGADLQRGEPQLGRAPRPTLSYRRGLSQRLELGMRWSWASHVGVQGVAQLVDQGGFAIAQGLGMDVRLHASDAVLWYQNRQYQASVVAEGIGIALPLAASQDLGQWLRVYGAFHPQRQRTEGSVGLWRETKSGGLVSQSMSGPVRGWILGGLVGLRLGGRRFGILLEGGHHRFMPTGDSAPLPVEVQWWQASAALDWSPAPADQR